MHRSKILKLLRTFTKDEFKEFGLFVESPVFNRERVLINLYKVLSEYYPEFANDDLNKTIVYKKIFPGKKFNDALMRNTISDFLKLGEEFLKHMQFKSNSFYNNYLLLKELTNRKEKSLFEINFKRTKALLNNSDIRDELYYQNKFLLEDEWRRNIVINSSKMIIADDNLNEQSKPLLLQHLIENLKLYALMLNSQKYYDHKFDFKFLEYVRAYIENNYDKYKDIPYITIYYNSVMLFERNEKKYYDIVRDELKKHYSKLTLTDRKNMYVVLTSFNSHNIKLGKYEYYRENFEVYKHMLKTKAYLEGTDFIQHYFYISITTDAIEAGETEWAEKFTKKYRKELHPDFRDSSYYYCQAIIYLNRSEYSKALELLSKVETLDIRFKVYIYQTLLKIYFAVEETESFISLIDSFRNFVRRNKIIIDPEKIFFNNLIRFAIRLFLFKVNKSSSDKSDIIFLKKEIEQTNKVLMKKWLLEKVNEMLLSNE